MKSILSLSLLFITCLGTTHAQSITARILDEKTKQPIPYATVEFGENQGIIANEEGRFSFAETISLDSVFISSMGYERRGVSKESWGDTVIYLLPKAIKLDAVYLFNNPLEVDAIIERTQERMADNHRVVPLRQRIFLRESSTHKIAEFEIDVKKTTIEELNKGLIDSIVGIIPRQSAYYVETLGDFYQGSKAHKLDIVKAAELYDKSNDGSMEALGKKLEAIFKENVKPDSYLKFKSGIFSQKIQIDSIIDENEEAEALEGELEKKNNKHFVSSRKGVLDDLLGELFFQDDPKLNVLSKAGRYRFTLLGYTDIGTEGVYVISFEPKRKADFKGVLYINIEDYAVMRIDFENVKRLRNFNMFGITYRENAFRGTCTFAKLDDGPYALRFMDLLIGRQMGLDRPLKVIEKNKNVAGRRKQNELSLALKMVDNNIDKIELVVFENEKIDSQKFNAIVEDTTVTATYMPAYNPKFWEGYTIMEPNTAIRAFKVSGE